MVSIVIPAYNAQTYLGECLDSVLAQTYDDWEAIVIDDGSTDATAEIARRYAGRDKRVRVISTLNQGLASARNLGVSLTSGEWIVYLDSDDLLSDTALERFIGVSEGVDIVIGPLSRVNNLSRNVCGYVRYVDGFTALEGCLYQRGFNTSACAKLFSRKLVSGIEFPDGLYYEDILYCVKSFLKVQRIAVISDMVYYYRDNPDSFINVFTPKRLDVLRITAMVEELCAHDTALLRAARDRRLSAGFNIFGLISAQDTAGIYDDVKDECWGIIKEYRLSSLRNPSVRLKNKVGILLSYFGRSVLGLMSKTVYA